MPLNQPTTKRVDPLALLLIACFSIVVLLFTSWDSYLFKPWIHHDVTWFYTCGKAWFNGMTPYVDFADSKGPLLWFFNGIGYLISPHSYAGLYWVECLLYTFVLYMCYRCARLFVDNRWVALGAVIICTIFFFGSYTHLEVRAEDYCYAFMIPVFYRFLLYHSKHEHNAAAARIGAITLGISFAGTLMIKYSTTLMMAAFIPFFLFWLPRKSNYNMWKALGWCALAALLTLLPMVIVLACQGCLDDCINEYFFTTAKTFNNMTGDSITLAGVAEVLLSRKVATFVLVIFAGILFYGKKNRSGMFYLLFSFLWFVAVIMLNGTNKIYYNVLALFTVCSAPLLAQLLSKGLSKPLVVAIFAAATAAFLFWQTPRHSLFTKQSVKQDAWNYYASLMAQYDSPRMLYFNCHDHGQGVPSHGLPACKYWSLQSGYTQEMLDDQINAVKQHKADVIIVNDVDTAFVNLAQQCGYYRYDYTDVGISDKKWPRAFLFSKKELKP